MFNSMFNSFFIKYVTSACALIFFQESFEIPAFCKYINVYVYENHKSTW